MGQISPSIRALANITHAFVDGEPVFVCNIGNEGFNSEAGIREHINDKHKSFMSDDLNDTDLYKGNIIV